MQAVVASIRPGQTSREVDATARRALGDAGLEPVLDGYRSGNSPAFPGAACVCINEEVVHSVPSDRIIRDGDLVTLDVAGRVSGWCADAAVTVVVGQSDPQRAGLCAAAREVLDSALASIAPGVRWGEVAARAAQTSQRLGYRLISGYDGHGIGRDLHEPPRAALALAADAHSADFVLRPGMVLTVEPVLTSGSGRVVTLDDGWTVLTTDRAPACHEERTVAVVRTGCRVLTGANPR